MLYSLACLYIIFYYLRPFEWMPGLIGLPVFQVLSLSGLFVLIMLGVSGKIRLFHCKTDIMVAGLFVAIALSHLSHGYVGGAIESLGKFFPILVGYFLIAHSLDSFKKFNFFLLLLISLTTILSYESYLQVHTGLALGGLEPLYQRIGFDETGVGIFVTRTRWYGVFNDPNDLGLALVMVVPLLLERLYQRRWVISLLILPPVLYSIYCTNSRGAILALVTGVFSYLVLRYRSYRGVVFGCLVAAVLIVFGPSRMAGMSGAEESAYGRIEAWYEGFQMFKSAPFFGVGQGMFTDFNHLTAHNSYVLVLAELGFLGSVFFVGLFALPLLWTWQRLYKIDKQTALNEKDRGVCCALTGSLIGTMTAMFFLSRSYILLPFLGVALVTAYADLVEKEVNTSGPDALLAPIKWKFLVLIVILEIVFINVFVKVFI